MQLKATAPFQPRLAIAAVVLVVESLCDCYAMPSAFASTYDWDKDGPDQYQFEDGEVTCEHPRRERHRACQSNDFRDGFGDDGSHQWCHHAGRSFPRLHHCHQPLNDRREKRCDPRLGYPQGVTLPRNYKMRPPLGHAMRAAVDPSRLSRRLGSTQILPLYFPPFS